jgi:predicted short-subunit dehydrogenase-like oxidoreductase (DUF2520 family)
VRFILAQNGYDVPLIGRGTPIPSASVTWITVPDREIANVAPNIPKGGVVLHASGAKSVEILRPHQPAGSLHPLMSFPGLDKGCPPGTVPAAIAGDEAAREAAHSLALQLGFEPFEVQGNRASYHASAVMAGNFATTLLVEAGRILSTCGLTESESRRLLAPLAMASLRNAVEAGAEALTGPIVRGDEDVITDHERALETIDPELATLYRTLTKASRNLQK